MFPAWIWGLLTGGRWKLSELTRLRSPAILARHMLFYLGTLWERR